MASGFPSPYLPSAPLGEPWGENISPTGLLTLIHVPFAGTESSQEDGIRVSQPTSTRCPRPPQGQAGQGAGRVKEQAGRICLRAAWPRELLELLVPGAGSRPSSRNAGPREPVARGSERPGAQCGLCAPTPTALRFRAPVSRETKAPVFFPEHKTGFFSFHPPPPPAPTPCWAPRFGRRGVSSRPGDAGGFGAQAVPTG